MVVVVQNMLSTITHLHNGHLCLELDGLSCLVPISGADPGFAVGGGADPSGPANIRFCQIFQNTT